MAIIGLITAKGSYENIRTVLPRFEGRCSFKIFCYEHPEQAVDFYCLQKNVCDGFLFSGWLPYATVAAACGEPEKPSAFFKVSEGDFFRTLFRLSVEHPGIDYRRVMVDDPEFSLDLSDIFASMQGFSVTSFKPLVSAMHKVSGEEAQPFDGSFYPQAMDAYRQAVQDGRADIIVTRLPNLSPLLTKEGLCHYVLSPGAETIGQCIDRLLYQVESGHYVDMLSVYGILEAFDPKDAALAALLRAASLFNRREGTPLFLSQDGARINIFTPHAAFRRLTDNLSDCKLSDALRSVGCRFTLGWGVGYDVAQAKQNATRAARLARHTGIGSSFAVDEQGIVTGPLLSEKPLRYRAENSTDIVTLSNRYDISRMHIKQILAIIDARGSNVFTSDELAQSLGVSPRSARRILCKLTDTGGATIAETNETGLRGRPGFRYCVTLT